MLRFKPIGENGSLYNEDIDGFVFIIYTISNFWEKRRILAIRYHHKVEFILTNISDSSKIIKYYFITYTSLLDLSQLQA